MISTIQKWGNSNAVRIPKPLLSDVSLKENDPVEITVLGRDILIRKITPKPAHRTLAERLEEARFAGTYQADEYDQSAVGDEVFW
ncbi:MAG: AbrB/MazE/SpoVT family DNA-binding domain-containing protein [Coriobacteriales bacterium]|nr:AbrB/MazE/SpoVT family DNA-binding domain-containing protein [Coriobacteriales bacterium]